MPTLQKLLRSWIALSALLTMAACLHAPEGKQSGLQGSNGTEIAAASSSGLTLSGNGEAYSGGCGSGIFVESLPGYACSLAGPALNYRASYTETQSLLTRDSCSASKTTSEQPFGGAGTLTESYLVAAGRILEWGYPEPNAICQRSITTSDPAKRAYRNEAWCYASIQKFQPLGLGDIRQVELAVRLDPDTHTRTGVMWLGAHWGPDFGVPEPVVLQGTPGYALWTFNPFAMAAVESASTREYTFTGFSLKLDKNPGWLGNSVPAGAALTASGGDSWSWTSTIPGIDPPPFAESQVSVSASALGVHQHSFSGAANPLKIPANGYVYAYVYLDPNDLPTKLTVQWTDGTNHSVSFIPNTIANSPKPSFYPAPGSRVPVDYCRPVEQDRNPRLRSRSYRRDRDWHDVHSRERKRHMGAGGG
jgi:hypothetical protein